MKSNKINLFIFCLFFLLISFNAYYFLIYRGVGPIPFVQKLSSNPSDNILDMDIYKDLREEYAYLNKNIASPKIVFLGDSITKRFNIQEFSGNNQIINRGIFFDTTHGLLDRLETNVTNLKLEKLFLMIGYNDLSVREDDEIINNIKKIVASLNTKPVYIQSLLPVRGKKDDINERIIAINRQLKKYALESDYVYVDLHSHFIDDYNRLKAEFTRDGVHLNFFGYRLWYALISHLL